MKLVVTQVAVRKKTLMLKKRTVFYSWLLTECLCLVTYYLASLINCLSNTVGPGTRPQCSMLFGGKIEDRY